MVQAEYTGLQNLYAMINYCINQSKCRRQVIAHHFGEVWNTSDCAKMCDVCRLRHSGDGGDGGSNDAADVVVSDVTHIGTGFIEILEDARMCDQRMTAAKLVDSWKSSDASKENRMLGKKELEYILARCLMEGVLREDYHFTPYNTISYIVPGARATALKAKRIKVKMETLSQNNRASISSYPMDRVFDKSFGSPPQPPMEGQKEVESTTPGSCGVSSVSSPSTASSNRKSASLLAKRKADSCSSGFSTIDEDFVVTPKRQQQHRTTSATKLSSYKILKGTSNSSGKARKRSLSVSKSKLHFTSSGSSKSVSATPEPAPSTSDIIEINSSDSLSD